MDVGESRGEVRLETIRKEKGKVSFEVGEEAGSGEGSCRDGGRLTWFSNTCLKPRRR